MEVVIIIGSIILFFILLLVVLQAIFIRRDVEDIHIAKIKELKGKQGERRVNQDLLLLLEEDEFLLTNVLLPTVNDNTTEIDTILISRKGVFCIEIKNWAGHIHGDELSEYWIQKYDDPQTKDVKHRNPVLQNSRHCSVLDYYLKNEYDVRNIIILTGLNDRSSLYSMHVYSIDEFKEEYALLPDNVLDEEEIHFIASFLIDYEASEEEIDEHADRIKNTYED